MKRITALLLAAVLLCGLLAGGTLAANKAQKTRTIAIVFDNSGSMYGSYNTSWCCATYALEVFASMLNEGDKLLVYPMNDISIGSDIYNFYQTPLIITSPDQAKQIESIYTIDEDGGTPIESVTAAYNGLKNESGEKWLLVLTDGQEFFEDGLHLGNATKKRVSETLTAAASDVNVMYLGIGSVAVHPDVSSANYHESFAQSGAEIPEKLTEMCNTIFGRDTLPGNHISGDTVDFDISIGKMIVFIQGTDIANVKVSGPGGTQGGGQDVHYPKLENAYPGNAAEDKSLQGMIVTYTDCPPGTYNISYSGQKSSVAVYYEPDVDIIPTVKDKDGNEVDPGAGLIAGDYTVEFTMIDRITGKETNSDLLGNPVFSATKTVNGQPVKLDDRTGSSCSIPISVKAEENLETSVTVQYLSGYSITKDNDSFGWPSPIPILPIPPKDLELDISGSKEFFLTTLEEGEPFIVKVFYDGKQLKGKELEAVSLDFNTPAGDTKIVKEFKDDHYELKLMYPDGIDPMMTRCGDYSIPIKASYTPENTSTAVKEATLSYTLTDNNLGLAIALELPTDYFVIKDLPDYDPIKVGVTLLGQPVSDEQLQAMDFSYEIEGVNCTQGIIPGKSAFSLKLEPTDGIKWGKHNVHVSVTARDELGRSETQTAEAKIELQPFSKLIKILLTLLIILLVALLLFLYLSAKTMPKNITFDPDESKFTIAGKRVGQVDNDCVIYDRKGKTLTVKAPSSYQYPLISCCTTLRLKPLSPRIKASKDRKVLVESVDGVPMGVKKLDIGGVEYVNKPKTGLEKDGPDPTLSSHCDIEVNGSASADGKSEKKADLTITLIFE